MAPILVFFRTNKPLPIVPDPYLAPHGGRCGMIIAKKYEARCEQYAELVDVDWSAVECAICRNAAIEYGKSPVGAAYAGKGAVLVAPPPTVLIYRVVDKVAPIIQSDQAKTIVQRVKGQYDVVPDAVFCAGKVWIFENGIFVRFESDVDECKIISELLPAALGPVWEKPVAGEHQLRRNQSTPQGPREEWLGWFPAWARRDSSNNHVNCSCGHPYHALCAPSRVWHQHDDYFSCAFELSPEWLKPLNNPAKFRHLVMAQHGVKDTDHPSIYAIGERLARETHDWLPREVVNEPPPYAMPDSLKETQKHLSDALTSLQSAVNHGQVRSNDSIAARVAIQRALAALTS